MWEIVNKYGEPMWQYGRFSYHDIAQRTLVLAKSAYPNAGLRLVWVDEDDSVYEE